MGARLETDVEAGRTASHRNSKESAIGIAEFGGQKHSKRIAIVGTLADTMLGFRGELIKDFVARGCAVFAFATDYTEQSEQQIRELGAIPVRYRMGQFSLQPIKELASIVQLYRLFRTHQIDISYCYFSKPAIYGTIAAYLAKVPTRVAKIEGLGRVFTVGPNGQSAKKKAVAWVMKRLFRFALPFAHHVIVLNDDDKRSLVSFGVSKPEPIVINGIGVNLDRYRYTPPSVDPVRFIFVGRLLREKGIDYFIEAAKAIKLKHPDVEFIVVGAVDDNPGAITKAELGKLVEQGIITYPGPVKDVVPWLAKSSVFVLPSYYREGVPRSSQEALAMGRPVITTDMPGCRVTVVEGLNGFLVQPHQQNDLNKAILSFVNNPGSIKNMSKYSLRLAKLKFDVRVINSQIVRVIMDEYSTNLIDGIHL